MPEPSDRQTDLEWLLSLGVTVEEAARRIGRTPTAIHHELKTTREKRNDD